MGLCVVLYEQQAVASALFRYFVRIGAATIEVHQQQGPRAVRDVAFDEALVYLQGLVVGLHQYGLQSVLRDGEDGGHKGVGWHQYLVAVMQHAQFLVGTEDERQRIQPVAAADAMTCADKVGIVALEAFRGLPVQIPSAADHLLYGFHDLLLMQGVDFL